MKRFAIVCAAVLGLGAVGSSANAGDLEIRFGGFNGREVPHPHRGFDPRDFDAPPRNFNPRGSQFQQEFRRHGNLHRHRRPREYQVYHDTSHYDWIPGHWVRHHGHYDWVPGRYVFHQEGHLDTIRPGRGHSHSH